MNLRTTLLALAAFAALLLAGCSASTPEYSSNLTSGMTGTGTTAMNSTTNTTAMQTSSFSSEPSGMASTTTYAP